MKKTLLIVMFVMFIAAGLTGCNTIKGAGEDIKSVPRSAAKTGPAIIKADNWIKENMW